MAHFEPNKGVGIRKGPTNDSRPLLLRPPGRFDFQSRWVVVQVGLDVFDDQTGHWRLVSWLAVAN
jgi:hypothetical protein